MKKLRYKFILFIFIIFFLFYFYIFFNKVQLKEDVIINKFHEYKTKLANMLEEDKNNYATYYFKIQNYIYSFLKNKKIFNLKDEFINKDFTASIAKFNYDPTLEVFNKKNNLVKKYDYLKDFTIELRKHSYPLSIKKKAVTMLDPLNFYASKDDIVLISSSYLTEELFNSLLDFNISVLITDKPPNLITSTHNIFFIMNKTKKSFEEPDKGFLLIYVLPSVFSELASFTYNNHLLHISAYWTTENMTFPQNIAFISGKLKNYLLIFQIPISKNIETIAFSLSLIDYLSSYNKKLLKSCIFFFSNNFINDYPAELDFINSFKIFPKNTRSIVLDNIFTKELEINTFVTKRNMSNIKKLTDEFTEVYKKYSIDYSLNIFDTQEKHFPYIYSKIPSLSIGAESEDQIEKNLENKILKSNLIIFFKLLNEIPLTYKIIFIISILLFAFFVFISLISKEEKDEDRT